MCPICVASTFRYLFKWYTSKLIAVSPVVNLKNTFSKYTTYPVSRLFEYSLAYLLYFFQIKNSTHSLMSIARWVSKHFERSIVKNPWRESIMMKLPGTRMASPRISCWSSFPPIQWRDFWCGRTKKTINLMASFSWHSHEKCKLGKTWFKWSHNWLSGLPKRLGWWLHGCLWRGLIYGRVLRTSALVNICISNLWMSGSNTNTGWIALNLNCAE